ncbi:hypothetical protein HJC23_003079 [Cyclotella cryptica]|uniref:Uncharacterized protein n=1 Tax=Cyclotella cryptica TaxID=29204 RepID=A0ABD3Q0P5_9STRA
MPIVWDRRCHFWRDGDRMDMTHQRGNTTVGASMRNAEAKAQEDTSMEEKDSTAPPCKQQPLLDNGSGKCGNLNNSDSFSATQCHASQLPLSSNGKSHRSPTAGPPMHQRRPSAGAIIAPSSQEDRRIDDRNSQMTGLLPPRLTTLEPVTGASTDTLRKENRVRRQHLQQQQPLNPDYFRTYTGDGVLPADLTYEVVPHKNHMRPSGLALRHPAAPALLNYATHGCPVKTGKPWTPAEMQAAIDRGPHKLALSPDAIDQLHMEVQEKVRCGQARLVDWKDICNDPPEQLKISPISMVPHKSRRFRTILDLSFAVRLQNGERHVSVNEATEKMAPQGAIRQLGHSLGRIIHAFASTADDEKVFMAKWDIKDGFWRLDCAQGEEWNFAYVLPQHQGPSTMLVVPNSLQMGWIESPPYFCAASETGRDVAAQYVGMPIGTLQDHKFLEHTQGSEAYESLPPAAPSPRNPFRYLIEVYVNDYIGLATATSRAQLDHVANSVMCAIHEVFPPDETDENDPISLKKLIQKEGSWDIVKEILGFCFHGGDKTIWVSEGKQDALIQTMRGWLRSTAKNANFGIPFADFRSTLYNVRHAFLSIPAGKGLMSPFYRILGREPRVVFLRRNEKLRTAVHECCIFLLNSVSHPTKCRSLMGGWPHIVGVTDASKHGVGGVIIGENMALPPTVFRYEWPEEIQNDLCSETNPTGSLTNSDLELAALLLLFLVIEAVAGDLQDKHVALYSDNSPSVHWVQRLAVRSSEAAMQKASPLTTLHIAGQSNAMTDVPSRSFGSEAKWHCSSDTAFLTLYNSLFPLPNQNSWNLFRLSCAASFYSGRVATSTKSRESHWARWETLVRPVGVDPFLQGASYVDRVRLLTGFAAYVRSGDAGRGRQVSTATVSTALTAVGQTIALATGYNPVKLAGSDKLIPRVAQMLDGWRKHDPPTAKKLPVEANVPEYLCKLGSSPYATELERAVGDLTVIAFYYLLRVGKYTCKGARNNTKQTVDSFKMEGVTFFRMNNGRLQQLARNAPAEAIMSAHSATLKLDNKKNGWKGVCIHQAHNGEELAGPVRALGRRYLHIRSHSLDPTTFLSSYFVDKGHFDVTDRNISAALKIAALVLAYPSRGFPIDRIDTHSLRSGGANALSLAGYTDRQIQKMGRWKGATFKEYIREELHVFSKGMSKDMKRKFQFVNISGGVFHDVTEVAVASAYTVNAAAA